MTASPAEAVTFRPSGQQDLAPSGEMSRLRANLDALRTLRALQAQQRPATTGEQQVLARWSGWGALPAVFDRSPSDADAWSRRYGPARRELEELLSAEELAAAARTTLNAHYTDAAYVTAIWHALTQLGFDGGRVLEPGCGCGTFIGFAPDGADMVGVEWDPTTAAIAAALYPRAQILPESFADTRIPEGSVDAVVGNVPFGDVVLTDQRHNPSGLSIHNHFIVKALHLTRPGGLVAVFTSRFTMDAANPAARRQIALLADLVGAVRVPAGAHRRAASTDAVTDLLVLRRHPSGTDPATASGFEQARRIDVDGVPVPVNEYFLEHPQRVLGRFATGGMHRADDLTVVGERDAAPALAAALAEIVTQAQQHGLTMTARPPGPTVPRPVAVAARLRQPDGYLQALPDGTFTRVEDGVPLPYAARSANQTVELRALLTIRDAQLALLEAEAASIDDTDEIDALRSALNDAYDTYVAEYGPINRFGQRRTGRVDPQTGEEVMARVYPPQGGFRDDPYSAAVRGLEDLDPIRQTARKADMFRRRVIAPRTPRLGADTPDDALAICIDTFGEVRLPEIARLLGVDETEARHRLGQLVFDDPATGGLVPAPEYLSGNVRDKLDTARTAAAEDDRYQVNVAALEKVVPADLRPGEIEARLGASWIDVTYVRGFLAEILDDPNVQVERAVGAVWTVKSHRGDTVLSTSRWGTERCPAPQIAQSILEQRAIRIYDDGPDNTRVFNPDATVAAQEKAREMAERFAEWAWQRPDRAAELAATYNRMFNSLVLRSYDNVSLSLPGLALSFKPRPHQIAAVARIIAEPSVGLWHEVGAGKTAEMAIGAMELRRLGLARKPAIVVPNHMLNQFTSEFHQLYPRAKLLAASSDDLTAERRRLFLGKATTGDWDAVVITRGAFERIAMSPRAQQEYLRSEIHELEASLVRAKQADENLSVKRLESLKLRAEERLKKHLERAADKDPGITFEQTGIDYVYIDEAHGYKNLRTPSNIANMGVDGSQRATDLHMKIEYLRQRSKRVVTFATATPIANSMGEAYTMLRYLRPDLLTSLQITDFDTFAATFGEVVTQVEVAPEGGMRLNSRFAKFINVPELLRPWHIAGDVKTADDLKLPVPALATRAEDGQRAPQTVIVPASSELQEFIIELSDRADLVRNRKVEPKDDNLLKITTQGRAAALDLRLVNLATQEQSKVDVAAASIADIWSEHRDTIYQDPDGEPHPTPGALQIVFADLGTPADPERFSVYDALRDQLVAHGVPRQQVRFIHEAKTDRDKADLFAACRDGRVAVLVGSTERMGVGTNVQQRAVALHHLDCPWRPADLQQREGRILRQGNQNAEVRILRYVTEGSFDAYSWQTVTRKAAFIAQVMRGRLDVREIEDIGDTALSYNEVKALAAGNPLLLDHAQATADVTRLERLERAHSNAQNAIRYTIDANNRAVDRLGQRLTAIDAALARRVDTRADQFAMTIGGTSHPTRAEAGQALRSTLQRLMVDIRTPSGVAQHVGELGGFALYATVTRQEDHSVDVTLELADVLRGVLTPTAVEIRDGDLVARLENRLHALDRMRTETIGDIDRYQAETDHAESELGQPFRQAEALTEARQRLDEIETKLAKSAEPQAGRTATSSSVPSRTGPAEVPIDSALDLTGWFRRGLAEWPITATANDRSWLEHAAADIACRRAVQARALTADHDRFTRAHDSALNRAILEALDASVLERNDLWNTYLNNESLRHELHTAVRQAVYAAIRHPRRLEGHASAEPEERASTAGVAFPYPPLAGDGATAGLMPVDCQTGPTERQPASPHRTGQHR